MSRRKKPEKLGEVGEELASQFGLGPAQEQPQQDVLSQLLESTDADDPEAVVLDEQELGLLQDEFDALARLKERKDALEEQLDGVKKAYEAQRGRMLSAMKLQGTKQFRGADGQGGCTIQVRYETKVTDPEAFMEWVKEQHPELLTVNTNTRSSFIRKEFRDKGVPAEADEFPPGIEAKERDVLALTGAKSKKKGGQ